MLEALTPGATLVLSACSCLFCVGLFWSFQVYFLPYLRQPKSARQPLLPHTVQATIDRELYHSLYDFPGLLHHCPRGSLAECELKSSKWSTSALVPVSLASPARTLHGVTRTPQHKKRRSQRESSANLSALRRSLMSESSLAVVAAIPTERSCSTITEIGHAGHAVPRMLGSYCRKSMPSLSDGLSGELARGGWRQSASGTVVLVGEGLVVMESRGGEKHVSPTETTFSCRMDGNRDSAMVSDENGICGKIPTYTAAEGIKGS